jgi:hydrogenase 3 maturation protease
MSPMCWQSSLKQSLQRLPQPEPRLAVVGVGQELHGDDAAGIRVARQLLDRVEKPGFLAIDAGPAPENYTGRLRRFAPDMVVVVDAAALNLPPGSIQLLTGADMSGFTASTHSLPLNLFASYLTSELQCPVLFIAIQPQTTSLGAALSLPVQLAVNEIVLTLQTVLEQG